MRHRQTKRTHKGGLEISTSLTDFLYGTWLEDMQDLPVLRQTAIRSQPAAGIYEYIPENPCGWQGRKRGVLETRLLLPIIKV